MIYTYVHEYPIEDQNGEIHDVIRFCSDYCHREWCRIEGMPYRGWNGLREVESQVSHPPTCDLCSDPIGEG